MGQTVASVPVRSAPVAHDDDADVKAPGSSVPASVAFASMGTGPAVTAINAANGKCRLKVTAGTGTPAIGVNNVQLTMDRAPRKVFMAVDVATPGFHVASIAGSVINIGSKVAPVASAVYNFELIVLY